MNLTVLNTNKLAIAHIDVYESLIWTDRYHKCGDFELHTPLGEEIPWYIKQENMLICDESEHVMVIETIETKSDVESGTYLTVSGRSLESILDRRIIWGQKSFKGNLQNGIKTMLESCFIKPTDSKRKVDGFIFKESTDPKITELTFEAQYMGDNLLEVIEKLCEGYGIGYKLTFDEQRNMVFELYAGADRSYGQMNNTYVVFSPEFENIINSNYLTSSAPYKNVTLVAGEGEGADRKTATVGSSTATGLERRELFTDASDISQGIDNVDYESGLPVGSKFGDGIFAGSIQLTPSGEEVPDREYTLPNGITIITHGDTTLKVGHDEYPLQYSLRSVSVDEVAEDDETTSKALTDAEYKALLVERGGESLAEHTYTSAFEGQIETNRMYKYGDDFFNGDIVQFANEYGNEAKVRIIEIVISVDQEGFLIYPTFTVINEGGEESV